MALSLEHQHALKLLHEISLGLVREGKAGGAPDLTMRQLAILLTIYLENPPHSVRGLARRLGVAKPVISRALNALAKSDNARRLRDEADGRNVVIQRTAKGTHAVFALGELVRETAQKLDA